MDQQYDREDVTRPFSGIARILQSLAGSERVNVVAREHDGFLKIIGSTDAALILQAARKPSTALRSRKSAKLCRTIPILLGNEDFGFLQLTFPQGTKMSPEAEIVSQSAVKRCAELLTQFRYFTGTSREYTRLRESAYRLTSEGEFERRRMSKELHDDTAQSLAVIRLQLELLETSENLDGGIREQLSEIREVTERAIRAIRRLIFDLSPAVLEQLGLTAALRQLANRFRDTTPCHVEADLQQIPDLPPDLELAIYRVAQGCLHRMNLDRPGRRLQLCLRGEPDSLVFELRGDSTIFRHESDTMEALGPGVCERVALLGGACSIYRKGRKLQSVAIRIPIS